MFRKSKSLRLRKTIFMKLLEIIISNIILIKNKIIHEEYFTA